MGQSQDCPSDHLHHPFIHNQTGYMNCDCMIVVSFLFLSVGSRCCASALHTHWVGIISHFHLHLHLLLHLPRPNTSLLNGEGSGSEPWHGAQLHSFHFRQTMHVLCNRSNSRKKKQPIPLTSLSSGLRICRGLPVHRVGVVSCLFFHDSLAVSSWYHLG